METFKIIFIIIAFGIFVPNQLFFVRKIILTKKQYDENNFVLFSTKTDSIIILIAGIIILIFVIIINLIDILNIMYNSIMSVFLALLSASQIINCRKKIIIKNNEIFVIPAVGKVKKFSFNDIDSIQEFISTKGIITYTVFQGERAMFIFSDRYIYSNLFIEKARKLHIKISRMN